MLKTLADSATNSIELLNQDAVARSQHSAENEASRSINEGECEQIIFMFFLNETPPCGTYPNITQKTVLAGFGGLEQPLGAHAEVPGVGAAMWEAHVHWDPEAHASSLLNLRELLRGCMPQGKGNHVIMFQFVEIGYHRHPFFCGLEFVEVLGREVRLCFEDKWKPMVWGTPDHKGSGGRRHEDRSERVQHREAGEGNRIDEI